MKSRSDISNEWLDTVAHDLRNPINLVSGCLDAIQNMGPLNERQAHYLDRAFVGLRRMEHLIARLKDVSWVDSNAPLDLGAAAIDTLIADAVDMLLESAEQRSLQITINIDKDLVPIQADAARVAQVMDNLLSNAIKYNKDGGHIFISAELKSKHVEVTVRDTGIGIAEEDQPHVFERFFRAQEGLKLRIEGSGLGLSIAHGIIQRHGGKLWFESEVGVGSTFHFSLPAIL